MDFGQIPLFAAMKRKVAWLTQRQEVLAQNIANADTPGYRPSDLKPFDFKGILTREPMQVNMTVTADNQLPGRRRRLRDFTEEQERKPYETAPAGNAVILEEQMMKVNDSQVKHRLATELYRKQIALFRIAIGK
jgi:flagellar basal-body rod protein FlgB